jgi:hypothetical protein
MDLERKKTTCTEYTEHGAKVGFSLGTMFSFAGRAAAALAAAPVSLETTN